MLLFVIFSGIYYKVHCAAHSCNSFCCIVDIFNILSVVCMTQCYDAYHIELAIDSCRFDSEPL